MDWFVHHKHGVSKQLPGARNHAEHDAVERKYVCAHTHTHMQAGNCNYALCSMSGSLSNDQFGHFTCKLKAGITERGTKGNRSGETSRMFAEHGDI